ncbi:MAG: transferrin-binding protein-like solute binding protein, partial [Alphaproteobacteria bacterium]|nr:transferrin-binding protein-like solute binding protein [Alphaproteobacteria bacterium]
LTGTANARFYGEGSDANELGGTFTMQDSNNTSYYYGAFGTHRIAHDEIANANIKTVATETYNSFQEVVADGAHNSFKRLTLNALAVSGNTNVFYQRSDGQAWNTGHVSQTVQLTKTSGASADITYGGHERIAYIGAYLKGKTYKTNTIGTDDRQNGETLTADITSGNPDNSISAKITADRNTSLFGFTPHYMTTIDWTIISDSVNTNNLAISSTHTTNVRTHTNGFMMAGFEVAGGSIPTSETVMFTGKGRGIYGGKADAENYATIFDITANVNFSTRNVALTSSNTACTGDNCANIDATTLASLNFTAPLTYALGINNISGAITAGNLQGTADARFYDEGPRVKEIGGTFSMQDNDNYYYGAFGGTRHEFHHFADTTNFDQWSQWSGTKERDGLSYLDDNNKPLTQTFDITQSGSVITKVKIKTLDINGNTIDTDNFESGIGGSQDTGFINDEDEGIRAGGGGGGMRIIHKTDKTKLIAMVHSSDRSPWDWDYQTVGVFNDGTTKGGFSTGVFTNDMPTGNSTINFTGRAYGHYQYNSERYITRADVAINVNFGDGTAEITTTNTRRTSLPKVTNNTLTGDGFEASSSAPVSLLNFTGTLRYNDFNKWFRGDIASTSENQSNLFDGGDADVVMKAYGPNAEEVGGVFRMKKNNREYTGAFGAKRP